MNWTGGKLQRHSKANANTQQRHQKQNFAKARQRFQNGNAPPPLSEFSILQNQIASKSLEVVSLEHSLEASNTKLPVLQQFKVASGNRPASVISIDSTESENHLRAVPTAGHQHRTHSPVSRQPAKPLENIKRRLLANSDWAGLAPTKPVRMTFTSAEEMNKIGRRRKTTAADKHKRQIAHHSRPFHHLIHPIRHPDSQSLAAQVPTENVSIRIGSNIHQTQTTRESMLGRVKNSAAPSKESMLFDKFENTMGEAAPQFETDEEIDLEESEHMLRNDSRLVPLNEALDLQSWDEVMERSSSISLVQGKSPSSTPFVDSTPGFVSKVPGSDYQPKGSSNKERSGSTAQEADRHRMLAHQQVNANPMFSVAQNQSNPAQQGRASGLAHFTIVEQANLEQSMSRKKWSSHPITSNASSPPALPLGSRPGNSLWVRSAVDVPQKGHEVSHGLEYSGPSTRREKFQEANTPQQVREEEKCSILQFQPRESEKFGDENEAWMRYVFPTDFDVMQSSFGFSEPVNHHENISAISPMRTTLDFSSFDASAPTNKNSTIFSSRWEPNHRSLGSTQRTETDFLSRYSPMAGIIDDGLGNVSTYTNPARTERTFLAQQWPSQTPFASQQRTLKRCANQAFGSSPSLQDGIQQRLYTGTRAQLWSTGEPEKSLDRPGESRLANFSTFDFADPRGNGSQQGASKHSSIRGASFPLNYSPASRSSRARALS